MMHVHPGSILIEKLDHFSYLQEDCAKVIGKPKSKLNAIINGNANITPEWAFLLGEFFSEIDNIQTEFNAKYWLDRQQEYDLSLVKTKNGEVSNEIRKKAILNKLFPIKELIKRGYLKTSYDTENLVNNIYEIFQISKDKELNEGLRDGLGLDYVKFKQSDYGVINQYNVYSWLRIAEIYAKKKIVDNDIKEFSHEELIKLTKDIKKYSVDGKIGVEKIINDLSKCGVIVVVLNHFEKTRVDGATFLVDKNPVVILSLRYDRLDNFWFTLSHELAHVVLHLDYIRKNKYLVEDWKLSNSEIEKEANKLASDFLIPQSIWDIFVSELNYSKSNILDFSINNNIHPAIVVGRLKYEEKIDYYQLSRLSNQKIDIPEGIKLS